MSVPITPALSATTAASGVRVDARAREAAVSRALIWIGRVVFLAVAGHLALVLWSRHSFTPVETLVAIHASMLAHGQGLYYDLNRYPYTVSPYGPIFYSLSALLQKAGVPALLGSRLLSFLALGAALWLTFRTTRVLTGNFFAEKTALLLAAATANVLFWGTVGQVDITAVAFSLAAMAFFLEARQTGSHRRLLLAGALVLAAVFTKQTAVSAGVAIGLALLVEDRKRAAWWIPAVITAGGAIALLLNLMTHGGYFADGFEANLNPFAWFKLAQQANYLVLTGAGVLLAALAGVSRITRRDWPVYLYGGLASAVWLVTAPKIGSDLNYQMEMMLAASICAACSLHNLRFFESVFASRRTWVTLLQMPLLFHITLNVVLTARVLAERALVEPMWRQQSAALEPFTAGKGRLLSVHYDSLLRYRGSIEVEALIYSLLVNAGRVDPLPLQRDLEARAFPVLILNEDVTTARHSADPELPQLPEGQLNAVRNHYKLVRAVEGPMTVYVYEPKRD